MKPLLMLEKYLKDRGRFRYLYAWKDVTDEFNLWTDTDYAGCKTTIKSTSRCIVIRGKRTV